jgi:hypothetical protein
LRRALLASLLVLAVVAGWISPRALTYVCAMDGRARSECCCAPHGEPASADAHARLEREGCCEVRSDHAVVAVASSPAHDRVLFDLALPSTVVHAEQLPLVQLASARRLPRGPPPGVGPPIHLRCCVFLI